MPSEAQAPTGPHQSSQTSTLTSYEEMNVSTSSPSTTPAADTSKQAHLVLLSCCMLQLPVWGFAISYGVLQEYYTSKGSSELSGNIESVGIIGTTLNGILYLSMPILFGLFTRRYARYRRHAACAGALISAMSLIASSFVTQVAVLIFTQGVLQAFGDTILYSSTTIYLDEWFIAKKGFAYGIILSVKSLAGVGVPLLFERLLSKLGFRMTLRIWAGISTTFALPAIFMLKPRVRLAVDEREERRRKLAWSFLRHRTFWVYQLANVVFSASYGLPRTYINQFSSGILGLDTTASAWMLVALNAPSVAASFWFGLLSDGKGLLRSGWSMSIASISLLSAVGASIPVFLFWGLVPGAGTAGIVLLTMFALVYGFFAGGYSATWGGVIKEMKREAEFHNEAIDTGLLYGLLNGGRGLGYVAGGAIGVQLLEAGAIAGKTAYGTSYGGVILFTGIGTALGGVSVLCRNRLFNW